MMTFLLIVTSLTCIILAMGCRTLSKRVTEQNAEIDRLTDKVVRIGEARRWLAEFPDVADALDWVTRDEALMKRNYSWWDINNLRGSMRARRAAADPDRNR